MPQSSRSVEPLRLGRTAAGESPTADGGRRTRRADGEIVKRSGGSRTTDSPSMPAATGEPEFDLEAVGRPLGPAVEPADLPERLERDELGGLARESPQVVVRAEQDRARCRAASPPRQSSKRSTLPPPDLGFISSTALRSPPRKRTAGAVRPCSRVILRTAWLGGSQPPGGSDEQRPATIVVGGGEAAAMGVGGARAAAHLVVSGGLAPEDLVAGLVLATLLVPQGMAYAELAGLPPITGLYTSILCLARVRGLRAVEDPRARARTRRSAR